MMKKTLLVLFLLIILIGCSYRILLLENFNSIPQDNRIIIKKQHLPLDKPLIDERFKKFLNNYYTQKFLEPLYYQKAPYSKKFILKPFLKLYSRNYHFLNGRKISKNFIKKLRNYANLENYPNSNLKGIVIKNSFLKSLPTDTPIFYKKFPFDIFQTSVIYYGTPVHISHFTKDKAWCFIESYIAAGWIKSENIATVDDKFLKKWYTKSFVTPIRDKIPIYNRMGKFITYAFIGSQFPLKVEFKNLFVINIITSNAKLTTTYVSKKFFKRKPIKLNYKNLSIIVNQLINKPYGWGGAYFYRDCSMMIRDLFAPFNIYLPRNSFDQINFNEYGNSPINPAPPFEKFINKNSIPYLTLIWIPGHIMLYTGRLNNQLLIFHNFWSVKVGNRRIIIGKSKITPLNYFIRKNIKMRNVIPEDEINLFR